MATANGLLFLQSLHYWKIASILMQSCITEDILKIWKKQQSVCSGNLEKKTPRLRPFVFDSTALILNCPLWLKRWKA